MNKHFEILFLDEAFEFLSSLERKHYEKILYIFVNLNWNLTLNFSKNSRTTFGNLGHFIRVYDIDCLPFGTRLQQSTLWLFRHTDLSKKK